MEKTEKEKVRGLTIKQATLTDLFEMYLSITDRFLASIACEHRIELSRLNKKNESNP